MLFEGPSVTREYHVEQPSSWPESLIRLNINNDGYLPSATMFFYVVPLQIRAYIIRGIGTSSLPTDSINTYEAGSMAQLLVDLNDINLNAKADVFVKNSISVFSELFGKKVEARLDYLERESKG
jgi:hypothetical protein